MSTQYRDGTWSEIEPVDDALATLRTAIDNGSAKSFVIGTQGEILKAQNESSTEKEIAALCRRLAILEAERGLSLSAIPTRKQMDKILHEPTGDEDNV